MKCPICKGTMKKIKDVIKEDGIEFEAFGCECGEELMDMIQLKLLAEKYRELRQSKDVIFSKWGNSIAVRIPGGIAREYNIRSGSRGLLTKDKKGIRIIPT